MVKSSKNEEKIRKCQGIYIFGSLDEKIHSSNLGAFWKLKNSKKLSKMTKPKKHR